MKKKIANALQLVLLLITFIILKLPTYQVATKDSVTGNTWGESPLYVMSTLTKYPIYFFYIMLIFMCIVSIIVKREHRDGKIHSILSVLWFMSVNFGLLTLSPDSFRNIVVISTDGFPGTIFEVFALAVVVVGYAKRSSLIAGNKEINAINERKSQADELKKYKELFDDGVITKEEFEAKKKQLLEL